MEYLQMLDTKDEQSELRRHRRNRTVFSSDSIALMEEQFKRNRYPDIYRREWLAEQIGVSEARVQVWFQNRRARSNKLKSDPEVMILASDQDNDDTHSRDQEKPNKRRKISRDSKQASRWPDSDVSELTTHNIPTENKFTFNRNHMFFQQTAPYLLKPFGVFPIAGPFLDFGFKQSPPFWNQESQPKYSGDASSAKKESEDNIVERLFRFSSPAYQRKKIDDHIQMMFPRIARSKYSMMNFQENEGTALDGSIMRAPRMSDARDSLAVDEFSGNASDSGNSSSWGSVEGSDISFNGSSDDNH